MIGASLVTRYIYIIMVHGSYIDRDGFKHQGEDHKNLPVSNNECSMCV